MAICGVLHHKTCSEKTTYFLPHQYPLSFMLLVVCSLSFLHFLFFEPNFFLSQYYTAIGRSNQVRMIRNQISFLKRFEMNVAPSEGDLKWVIDYIGFRVGVSATATREEKWDFLWSLMQFMRYCICVVIEVVDGEEGNSKSGAPVMPQI